MSKKDKRNKRRVNQNEKLAFWEMPVENLSKERQKARDLRKTAWWKRKLSEGKCYYCHKDFSPDELTMDHLIPVSRGGTSEKINLVTACKECNNKKKYLLPVEWQEYLDTLK